MACKDQDKFNLLDHGHDASVALQQLLRVPKIANGVLGRIISYLQKFVLPISEFTWIPDNGTNAGSAAGFFEIKSSATNKIKLKKVAIVVMENKRSQVVHEMIHGLDMYYYFFNIDHPPTQSGLSKRVPVLYLNPLGDIWKYNHMDLPFVDQDWITRHENSIAFFQSLARKNNLLKQWQRDMLMFQLNYAARADKMHVEFTANVAQCLALIYQWGFTGDEKGLLGNPRSIALMIRQMERVLKNQKASWLYYMPPARKTGSVVQFVDGDKRKPPLDEVHFEKDKWWKVLGKDDPLEVIP